MLLDIDDFSDVNDSLGHDVGDEVLIEVASRLTNDLHGSDTIGRLGGNEFVVLVDGDPLDEPSTLLAHRALKRLGQPFQIAADARTLSLAATVGIAEGIRAWPEELLRDASIALSRAKATGKGRVTVFSC